MRRRWPACRHSLDQGVLSYLYLNNPSVRYSHLGKRRSDGSAAPEAKENTDPGAVGATVEAIQEAAIQVLLADGLARLTTTRVAERAGVSVGTLYQYFPNKEALLFAILQRHFEEMAESIERISIDGPRRPLADLADSIADAYVSVKIARPEATTALYRVAGAIDQFRLSTGVYKRLEAAVVRVLANASDASFHDVERVAFTLLSALAGVSRGTFGRLFRDRRPWAGFGKRLASCRGPTSGRRRTLPRPFHRPWHDSSRGECFVTRIAV